MYWDKKHNKNRLFLFVVKWNFIGTASFSTSMPVRNVYMVTWQNTKMSLKIHVCFYNCKIFPWPFSWVRRVDFCLKFLFSFCKVFLSSEAFVVFTEKKKVAIHRSISALETACELVDGIVGHYTWIVSNTYVFCSFSIGELYSQFKGPCISSPPTPLHCSRQRSSGLLYPGSKRYYLAAFIVCCVTSKGSGFVLATFHTRGTQNEKGAHMTAIEWG